ncbi:MAG: carbohydrate-binding domain-containing protein [Oscillospiraceae bacterium]|nr:carbohydrate-binding domain-containing protein [Oscillospiraceae bacterium]
MFIQKKYLALLSALACFLPAAGCAKPDGTASKSNSLSESSQAEQSTPDPEADTNDESRSVNGQNLSALSTAVISSVELSKADLNTAWDDDAVSIRFDGDSVTASASDGITIAGGVITVTKGGTYVLSGTLDDGRLIINLADKSEKVHLILNGVSMTSSTSAPLTVLQADKTIITLAAGTDNSLSDAKEYKNFDLTDEDGEGYPGACIASKDDLTINGTGSLTVTGNYNNGIHCSDDLRIVSGQITVTAVNHGIRGNDSVLLHDGSLSVTAGGDGIKSATSDEEGKGYILIEGGSAVIRAEQDGIDAAASLTVTGGSLDITAGGGAENAEQNKDNMMPGGGFGGKMPGNGEFSGQMPEGFPGNGEFSGQMPEGFPGNGEFSGQMPDGFPGNGEFSGQMPEGFPGNGEFSGKKPSGRRGGSSEQSGTDSDTNRNDRQTVPENIPNADSKTENSVSKKGMKTDTVLTVTGGTIRINSADDALHANGSVNITGSAELNLSAGDDGIHGDSTVNLTGDAKISILSSYEGIEAHEINVCDGEIHVNASDDGFNASGNAADGSEGYGMRNGSGELNLTGGYVYVNAGGDGLDSNGNIMMTGGTVIVCGPTNNGNGPLDSGDNDNHIIVTGGTLIAVGSTGMIEAPDNNYIGTTQLNAAAGTLIVVTDENGEVLGALKTPKAAQGIVFSADGKSDGYSVYTGGSYSGTLNEDGWGTGGTYSGGTLITSGSGGITGGGMPNFGRRGGDRGENT